MNTISGDGSAKISINSSDLNADDFEFIAGTIAGSGQPNGAKVGGPPLTISMDIAGALFEALDLFAATPLDKLDSMISAYFDGIALGHAESNLPDAEDLAGLAEDLEARNGGSDTADAFALGRRLGESLPDHGRFDPRGEDEGPDIDKDVAQTEGLPDPLAGSDAAGGKPSAMDALDVFTQTRGALQGAFGAGVEQRSLTDPDPRTGTGDENQDGSVQDAAAAPAGADGAPALLDSDGRVDPEVVLVVAAVVAAGALVVATGGIALGALEVAAYATTVAGVAEVVAVTALGRQMGWWRPAEDAPAQGDTEITMDEFLSLAAEKVAGLVLKTSEDPDAARPEDVEAFKLELLDAIWEAVSRPAETDDSFGTGGGGFDPEDLMHELEPEWDGPSPIPEDINPSEPIDPTGGAGASTASEGEFLA